MNRNFQIQKSSRGGVVEQSLHTTSPLCAINGEVHTEDRGNQILQEFLPANYYRQFELTEHIDADKSQAELKNGVLTLTIPKAESAKPRKIEIRH